jgi:hypothetical protein
MREETADEDDLGELFQLFEVLADASAPFTESGTTPEPNMPRSSSASSPSIVPPLLNYALAQQQPDAVIRASFLRAAQRDFSLPIRISNDIDGSEDVPFLAFVACMRGEMLSQKMLGVFRLSSPLAGSEGGDSTVGNEAGGVQHLSDALQRRTQTLANASEEAMNSVRSARKKAIGAGANSQRQDGTSSNEGRLDAAHRAFVLMEKLYAMLAAEISSQSQPIELISTPWTEAHADDGTEAQRGWKKIDRTISDKVFPVQFRKKSYTLAEVEALIDRYERQTAVSWAKSSAVQSPTTGRLFKGLNSIKYVGKLPLPKLQDQYTAQTANRGHSPIMSDFSPVARRKSQRSNGSVASSLDCVTSGELRLPEIHVSPSPSPATERTSKVVISDERTPPGCVRASSLPALKTSPLQSLSPDARSESVLAGIYHQQFPKIPADFRRKFKSDLSDRLYKHVRATSFDKLTLARPYIMPVGEQIEMRQRYKQLGALSLQAELSRVGFCFQSIPTIAAQALRGLEQVHSPVSRSLDFK